MNPTVAFTDVLSEPQQTAEGEYVTRSGLIFRAGDYESHDFSMSPEELAAAAEAFQPCDLDLEHTDTVLNGKLGRLESVSLGDDGTTLHGVVRLPKWLDDALGDTERKVSATWSRAQKRLEGLALVLNPRVADAALMSAYAAFAASRHDTPQGQMAMQRIHQVAAESGAVCSKGNASMASSHESSAIQKIHDLSTEHGAACSSTKPGGSLAFPTFGAQAPTAATTQASTATTPPAPKEGRTMSWKDRLLAAISGMPDDDSADTSTTPAPPVAAAVMAAQPTSKPDPRDAELARLRQERDVAQAETNRIRAESISREAVAFADRMLTEARAFPAEREAIITAHQQAAIDDVTYGVVTFGDGQTTTRIARFEAAYAARPAHQLTAESLSPALMSVLQGHRETPTQEADRKATPEELEKLLNMTSQGQAVVAMTRGTNSAGHTNGRA